MNRIKQFFYNKTKKTMEQELIKSGLTVLDEDKFKRKVNETTKSNIINLIVLIVIAIMIIIKWVMQR